MKWVGQPVRRKEDARFVTGQGRYTDDINIEGQAHAAVTRSTHAHARIRNIDLAAAAAAPGVLGVFTQPDLEAGGVKPYPTYTRDPRFAYLNADGSEMPDPPQWALTKGKVRFVGEPVAFVVAETRAQARDAAEMVSIDYETLATVTTAAEALAPGAPRLWDDVTGNLCFDWARGDRAALDAAVAEAAHLTRLTLVNNRIIVAYMEPRTVLAAWDAETGRTTVQAPTQGTHRFCDTLSETLGGSPRDYHVMTPDVGGGFGPRGFMYPEIPLSAWASRRLGRPVKWTAERGECFATDLQARDQVIACEMAFDSEGRILGLHVESDFNMGGFVPARGIYAIIAHMAPIITGVYHIPALHFRLRGVLTNTVPVYALRGIGRAEATHILERLLETGADEMGIDRIALRRRNLIPPSAMPYASAGGSVYRSGEFERNMDLALEAADWGGFAARRAAAERGGRRRGIALINYVENAGGAPSEFAEVAVDSGGTFTTFAGSQSFGQGHETTYAQVTAEELGIHMDRIAFVDGDTDRVRAGYGSHGSRSMRKAGIAIQTSARQVIEKGKVLAGDLLEAAAADIEYGEGRFRVAGTDHVVTLFEVAAEAEKRDAPLAAHNDVDSPEESFPNGCHVAEVEVDPDTGRARLVRHTMVNDVGRAINPLIVHGQLHGGIAQGVGQALIERTVHETGTGQLLSGSFMDYAVPRADDLPALDTLLNEVPCPSNPLGVKGAGEGGTTGAPPAVVNAILDALRDHGIAHIDMPLTPERLWRAIRAADGGT